MRLPFRIILIFVAVFLVWLFSYSEYYYLPKIQSKISNSKQYYPFLEEDIKLVYKNPPFENISKFNNNADLVMEENISMLGKSSVKNQSLNTKSLERVFQKYPKWKTDKNQLEGLISDQLIKDIDTSWLDKVQDFTHWKYISRKPYISIFNSIKEKGGLERIRAYRKLDTPKFVDLRKWAVIHLIQKHNQNRTLEGFRNFRKIAELTFSTNNLTGMLVATSFLKYEHLIQKHISLPEWDLVPNKTIYALNRALTGWSGIFSSIWLYGFNTKFSAYMKPNLGFCSAITESSFGGILYSEYLKTKLFYETDLSKDYTTSRALLSRYLKVCNLNEYAPFISEIPKDREKWSRYPVLGRLTALYLLRNSSTNFFMLYKK